MATTPEAASAPTDLKHAAWSGRFLEVVVDGSWEYVRRARAMSAAVVLAITDEGEIVLVEQHRPPLGRAVIELPAGLIGDDDGPGEEPVAAAARELVEETGFHAANWKDLGEFATSPGMSAETFHLFLATGLERQGEGGGRGGEAITVHVVALAQSAAWLAAQRARGLAIDCRLVALLPWASLA